MKPTTAETLITNLKMLMAKTKTNTAWIARQSGVSKRMVDYILSGERGASIEVAEKIANAYGITGWQLIMPSLPYDLASSGKLDRLINKFEHCSQVAQDYVLDVLKREATNGDLQ